MTMTETGATHRRVVTAYFDTEAAAQKAVSELERVGVSRSDITLVPGRSATTASTTSSPDDTGFWASLKDMFLPEEDRYAYAEGLRRGGYVLSVRANEAQYERILDIVDAEGSVDIGERETAWRAEGWTGYAGQTGTAAGIASGTAASRTATAGTAATAARETAVAGQGETIPVYEEHLQIGKRDVSHGRVRLRSYVVETPVNEQVSLRREDVQVERRPVDRAVAPGDAVFNERTIEVEERAEEAVVAKDVRLKEEVSLRKTVQDQVHNVSDTVRRTEVEIDDARGATGGTARRFVAAQDAGSITEHMDVLSSDGRKVGVVDHLEGSDRIKLTKASSADGQHHYVPLAWVDHVDRHVHLNVPEAQIRSSW